MLYIWVPFEWLRIGDLFEPIDVLYGYCPIFMKISSVHGKSSSHRGEENAILANEEYVRICLAWYNS